jgi:prepilin-type N-terminal cleavage/methylation domain-containing protein
VCRRATCLVAAEWDSPKREPACDAVVIQYPRLINVIIIPSFRAGPHDAAAPASRDAFRKELRMKRLDRRGRAFTLLELLAVIFIIAVVTAVLLPTMQRTHCGSNREKCGSNPAPDRPGHPAVQQRE